MENSIIERAAECYGITPEQLYPLPGGHFNQVFGYEQAGCAYVLRLTPPHEEINLESTRSILVFLKYLADGGANVPEPVSSLSGQLVETLANPSQPDGPPYLVTVFLRASGGLAEELPVMVWEDALLEAIGRAVGRFHALSAGYHPAEAALDRPQWDQAGSCFNPPAELAAAVSPESPHHWILEKRAAVLAEIARLPRTAEIYGIIHADLHFGNIYFERQSRPGQTEEWSVTLLDFDDCAYGWFSMDIAMNLLDALVLRRPPDEEAFARHFLAHYLKGYQEEFPLDPFWQDRLPLFLKLLELGLYLAVADAYDPGDSESWIGKFMAGRRERIEKDVPVANIDDYPGICMEKSLDAPLPAVVLPPGYSIRSISIDEGALWEQVMDQSFGGYGPGDFQKVMVENYDFDPSRVFLMFDELGQPCATATSWRQHYRWGSGIGYVLFVGVARSHQGRGLGYRITLHILHDFVQHGLNPAILETNETNFPALKTYLNLGFRPRLLAPHHADRWEKIFAGLKKEPVDYPRNICPPVDAPHPPRPYPYELKIQRSLKMELSGITHLVKDLEKARQFYEDLLGFEPGPAYEPTRWQSYHMLNGAYFAIGEAPGSFESVAFGVDDVEALWERVKDSDQVIEPLNHTPWGTYRFVIRDPDGHLITFMQK